MRRSEIDEMILDILSSFSDFQMFKQTFITYRKVTLLYYIKYVIYFSIPCYLGKRRSGGGSYSLHLLNEYKTRTLNGIANSFNHSLVHCIYTVCILLVCVYVWLVKYFIY